MEDKIASEDMQYRDAKLTEDQWHESRRRRSGIIWADKNLGFFYKKIGFRFLGLKVFFRFLKLTIFHGHKITTHKQTFDNVQLHATNCYSECIEKHS